MTGGPTELPIACSLDAADLQARERRWAELVRTAGTGRRAAADGIELRFRAGDDVRRELRELVDAERECCAWARWELGEGDDGGLVMRAHAGGHGIVILRSMFRLQPDTERPI